MLVVLFGWFACRILHLTFLFSIYTFLSSFAFFFYHHLGYLFISLLMTYDNSVGLVWLAGGWMDRPFSVKATGMGGWMDWGMEGLWNTRLDIGERPCDGWIPQP
jgi:hypothetical protein